MMGLTLLSTVTLAQPQEAQLNSVTSCNFIDTVEGSSGYGKKVEWQSTAKVAVLNRAAKLGASHVVWERFNPVGAFNGIAIAKAYKCSS